MQQVKLELTINIVLRLDETLDEMLCKKKKRCAVTNMQMCLIVAGIW